MSFCPFISTPSAKKTPSKINCAECCFYVYERSTNANYCAILLTAERASNAAFMLSKTFGKQNP